MAAHRWCTAVPITTCAGTDNHASPPARRLNASCNKLCSSAYPSGDHAAPNGAHPPGRIARRRRAAAPPEPDRDIVFDLIERYAEKAGGLHTDQAQRVAEPWQQVAGRRGSRGRSPSTLTRCRYGPIDAKFSGSTSRPNRPSLSSRDALLSDLIARLSAGHSPLLHRQPARRGQDNAGRGAGACARALSAARWRVVGRPGRQSRRGDGAESVGGGAGGGSGRRARCTGAGERLSTVLGDRPVLVVLDGAWKTKRRRRCG